MLVGVDTGGTFTDLVVGSGDGTVPVGSVRRLPPIQLRFTRLMTIVRLRTVP